MDVRTKSLLSSFVALALLSCGTTEPDPTITQFINNDLRLGIEEPENNVFSVELMGSTKVRAKVFVSITIDVPDEDVVVQRQEPDSLLYTVDRGRVVLDSATLELGDGVNLTRRCRFKITAPDTNPMSLVGFIRVDSMWSDQESQFVEVPEKWDGFPVVDSRSTSTYYVYPND